MKKSEMIESLVDYYTDGNKAKFASMIGVKPQTLSAWISRNTFDAELIYKTCKGVSANWLLTGEGQMIADKEIAGSQPAVTVAPADQSLREENSRLRGQIDILRELAGLKKKGGLTDVG